MRFSLRNEINRQCASDRSSPFVNPTIITLRNRQFSVLFFSECHGVFKDVFPEGGLPLLGLRCGHDAHQCGLDGVGHRPYGDAKCPAMDGSPVMGRSMERWQDVPTRVARVHNRTRVDEQCLRPVCQSGGNLI